MAEENKKHSVTMDSRSRVSISGVLDVLSFDEDSIVADTVDGAVVLRGHELHINSIDLDKGELMADGAFTGFGYEDAPAEKQSLFGRIFR